MSAPLLSASGIHKHFGGLHVLKSAWIEVEQGMIVGLIGPNGAGKSTFFSVLSGFLPPDQGDVRLKGTAITKASPQRIARQGLVRTFQVPREFGDLTVLENMMVAEPKQHGESVFSALFSPGRVRHEEAAIHTKAMDLLDFLGLDSLALTPARALSGGQKKLLELGRVLMLDPQIILLDEPFAGVNPSLINTIIDRLFALRDRGLTLLIVEHNMAAITTLSDIIFVMADGSILMSGPPAQVKSDPQVLEAYLGGTP